MAKVRPINARDSARNAAGTGRGGGGDVNGVVRGDVRWQGARGIVKDDLGDLLIIAAQHFQFPEHE